MGSQGVGVYADDEPDIYRSYVNIYQPATLNHDYRKHDDERSTRTIIITCQPHIRTPVKPKLAKSSSISWTTLILSTESERFTSQGGQTEVKNVSSGKHDEMHEMSVVEHLDTTRGTDRLPCAGHDIEHKL